MGIKDLLGSLQCYTSTRKTSDLKGMRIAVDTSGWLHKGLYVSAEDYVDSGFVDNQLYIDFILSRVKTFEAVGVKLVLVFDGKRNNMKGDTHRKREDSRTRYLEQGYRLVENMRSAIDAVTRSKLRLEAIACFQRGMAVTHDMENSLIGAARKMGVDVIVSPYEADAQLAYLCNINYCQGVLTEDSDVLVYSAICGTPFPIYYKFDSKLNVLQELNLKSIGILGNSCFDRSDATKATGSQSIDVSQYQCDDVSFFGNIESQSHVHRSRETTQQIRQSILSSDSTLTSSEKTFIKQLGHFQGTNGRRLFVQMCVLAGCDYSESIQGVGLITAQAAVIKFKDATDDTRIEKICKWFRVNGKNVPDAYKDRAHRAESLFFYQPVYNPNTKRVLNFMTPRIDVSMDSTVTILSPLISDEELVRLGGEQHILQGAPVGASTIKSSDLCDGLLCYQSFVEIGLKYPWEGKPLNSPTNSSGWAVRRKLMSVLGFNTATFTSTAKSGPTAGIQKKKIVAKPSSSYFKSSSIYSNNGPGASCRPYQSQVQEVADSNKAYSKYFNAPIKVLAPSAVTSEKPTAVIAVSPKADEFLYDVEDDVPDVSNSSLNSTATKDQDHRVTVNTVTPDPDITILHTNISSPLNTLETFAYKQAYSTVKVSQQQSDVTSNKENNGTAFSRLLQVKRKPEAAGNTANAKKQKKGTTAVPLNDKNTIKKFLYSI